MKNKGFLALATVGAIALMASKQGGDNAATSGGNLAFTGGDMANVDSSTVDAVIQAIKDSPALRNLLKGEKGAQGSIGLTGAIGPAGENIPNYARSLIKNGALELGDTQNWANAVNIELPLTKLENSNVIHINATGGTKYITNLTAFLTKKAVLKLHFKYKSVGATSFIRAYFKDLSYTAVTPSNGASATYADFALSAASSYTEKTVYISGLVGGSYFNDAKTLQLAFFANTGADFYMYDLVVEFVSKGEPVPYNLNHLPTGQVVYDPTTYASGIYNGTAVVWT